MTALNAWDSVLLNPEAFTKFSSSRIQWNFEPMRNHAVNCFELYAQVAMISASF
jgi:hypothetical protein